MTELPGSPEVEMSRRSAARGPLDGVAATPQPFATAFVLNDLSTLHGTWADV